MQPHNELVHTMHVQPLLAALSRKTIRVGERQAAANAFKLSGNFCIVSMIEMLSQVRAATGCSHASQEAGIDGAGIDGAEATQLGHLCVGMVP